MDTDCNADGTNICKVAGAQGGTATATARFCTTYPLPVDSCTAATCTTPVGAKCSDLTLFCLPSPLAINQACAENFQCPTGSTCNPATTPHVCTTICTTDADCGGTTVTVGACAGTPVKACTNFGTGTACNAATDTAAATCTTGSCNPFSFICEPTTTTTTTTTEATATTIVGSVVGLRTLGQSCIVNTAGTTGCLPGLSCNPSAFNLAGETICTSSCIIGGTFCGIYTCTAQTNSVSLATENYCAIGSLTAECLVGTSCTSGVCNFYTLRCTTFTTTTITPCQDLVTGGSNDCGSLASLGYCTNTLYFTLMKTKCQKSCRYCTSTTSTSTCADLINPTTGVNDCPERVAYCTTSIYRTLMRTQCPLTCGVCSNG
uniref:ShKT domain-containing protein n=1 Tax=Rhabditophanes sp. KR3021 TaxID=114890 RepID=A0AC35UCQ7_9BILA